MHVVYSCVCVCRPQDRLIDFETRMLRRIDYLQEVDTKRVSTSDVRLQRMEQQQQRMESLLQLLVQHQRPTQSGAQT